MCIRDRVAHVGDRGAGGEAKQVAAVGGAAVRVRRAQLKEGHVGKDARDDRSDDVHARLRGGGGEDG
eukprot:5303830-Prymnesium_polylepis.1